MQVIEQALDTINFPIVVKKSNSEYTYNGTRVPRVTEVLSKTIHSDGLMYWANSLGLRGERYRDILNKAAAVGTAAHKAIEIFLKDKIPSEDNTPFLSFLLWYNIIVDKLPIEVVYLEHRIACQWFGGTLDALLKIGNRLFLVDFKTSNHVTYNYFLQLAAYKYMLRVIEGIEVDGVIVLQLNKEEPAFNEYMLDFSVKDHNDFINHCEITFLSLVYAFYNLYKTEKDYNDIF